MSVTLPELSSSKCSTKEMNRLDKLLIATIKMDKCLLIDGGETNV